MKYQLLFVSLASPKILSLDNKRKITFFFVLFSFICIFVASTINVINQNEEIIIRSRCHPAMLDR